MKYLFLILALVVPGAASAQGLWNTWITDNGEYNNGVDNCEVKKSGICWYDFVGDTASTDLTPIMQTRECENASLYYTSNIADESDNANKIKCFELNCVGIDATDDCADPIAGVELDGDAAASPDTSRISGFDAGQVYCRTSTAFGAGETGRLRFSCFPR